MDVSLEYFRENFPYFQVHVLAIRKIYLTKYILFVCNDSEKINNLRMEKKTESLRQLYAALKLIYPNFPFTENHDDNLYKILIFAREELASGRSVLLDNLHSFFFRTKSFNVLTKEYDKEQQKKVVQGLKQPVAGSAKSDSDSEMNDSIIKAQNSSFSAEGGKPEGEFPPLPRRRSLAPMEINAIKLQTDAAPKVKEEVFVKVFAKLFLTEKKRLSTNFQRLVLNERLICRIDYSKYAHDLIPLQFRIGNGNWKHYFVNFGDGAMFFYDEKRRFMLSKHDYSILFLLLKVDFIHVSPSQLGFRTVTYENKFNLINFEFLVHDDHIEKFTSLLSYEIIKKESMIINMKRIPIPTNVLGNGIIYINSKHKKPEEQDLPLNISSNFINLQISGGGSKKMLIFPLLNVFDVFLFTSGKKEFVLETLSLFNMDFNIPCEFCQIGGFTLSTERIFNYIKAYVTPKLDNYHESRYLSGSIKNNVKELTIATFRLKRVLALTKFMSQILTDFMTYKYPKITFALQGMMILITLLFGLEMLLLLFCFVVLLYFNPKYQDKIDDFLNSNILIEEYLNRNYLLSKFVPEKQKRYIFYREIGNINAKEGSSVSLKQKIQGAFDFSSKLPLYINDFLDVFEKVKNLVTWKDYRKTQVFFFAIVIIFTSLFLFGKNKSFIFFQFLTFYFDFNYYKRVRVWNKRVIMYFLDFFREREYPNSESSLQTFFANAPETDLFKATFSRKFSQYLHKYLDIKTEDTYWLDKISIEAICSELNFSSYRLIFSLFEEKRKPNIKYQLTYFLFSTPTDFYYHNLSTKNYIVPDE